MTRKEDTNFLAPNSGPHAEVGGGFGAAGKARRKFKPAEGLALGLIVLYLLLGLGFGGYALWRRAAGNIQGTWEKDYYFYYDKDL